MSWLKSLWGRWKVQVSFVSGALVVATAYGSCTVDPNESAIKEEILKEKPAEVEELKKEVMEEPKKEEKSKEEAISKP